MSDASSKGAAASASASEKTPGPLWSAWPEDDCDSDPRIDPMAQKVTEWFVGRWPLGAEEPECRILIGQGRSAEIVARRLAEKLTSILNTDAIVAQKAAHPPAVPESVRRLSEADELTEDEVRRRAKAVILDCGWKFGDQMHGQAVLGLMTRFGLSIAKAPPQDRCAHPECGCDADAVCGSALAPAPPGATGEEGDPLKRLERMFGVTGVTAVFRAARAAEREASDIWFKAVSAPPSAGEA